ncbi:galectin-4-like isoform X2 [Phymastichus coffea]|uniref:galectin-4-like isoform X2 n=1 Tax=Phymastichus coffea TaxID=108790 RepID=UPI00273B9A53|nr:galectin-4-like isoform X2 [Phymastichus coffea]
MTTMSREWPSVVVARRNEALKHFTFDDPESVPVRTGTLYALEDLKPSSTIIVTGYIPIDATRNPQNVALHFNPRLDRGYVVRNSKLKGCWQEEETCSPLASRGYIFRRGRFFQLTIFCTQNEFQVAIDGEHFCAFAYRLPLEDVAGFELNDHVEQAKVRQDSADVYPEPRAGQPDRALRLVDGAALNSNLELPALVDLPNGLGIGARLTIKGRLKLLPHSFYVNLQRGKTIYPHPEIALHLNPRYHYGNAPSCLVMNCWSDGSWQKEERHHGQSWTPGREFLLTVRCEHEAYVIWLNDRMIAEFRHRLQPSLVDTVHVAGDLVLYEMLVSY